MKARQPNISDAADTYQNLQTKEEDVSSNASPSSSCSSSNSSDIVKASNYFGNMAEDQRRVWLRNTEKIFKEEVAKSVAADPEILEDSERSAEIRSRNNVNNVKE